MIELYEMAFSSGNDSLEMIITRVLFIFGIPANLKGYKYIREALIMTIKDREVVNLITKVLYPDIAKKYGTSPSCVSCSIRHAIEVSWQRVGPDCTNNVYAAGTRKKPTNSQFIATIADWLLINGCTAVPDKAHQAS